jgi:GAF domain-containing protein
VNDLAADPKLREMASLAKGLRSQIAIPIRLKGQLIGALNIGSSEPYAFSEEHVGILEPLAQELGSVIDRVNLFRQVSDDAAYVHTLLNSIDSIVYTVDPQCRIREGNKAWHEYLRECGMDSPADGVNPNLFDFLPDPALKLKIQAVVDQLLAGSIRFFSEEHTVRFPARDRVYQLTINPMLIGQRITGLVFAHVDITEVKHAEEVLKRNNEQLLALNEISALASTSLRIEDILEGAVPLLKKAMEADVALVYLRETEGTDLLLVKQSGFDESVVPSISRLTPSDSVTGKAVERNTPTYISEKAYRISGSFRRTGSCFEPRAWMRWRLFRWPRRRSRRGPSISCTGNRTDFPNRSAASSPSWEISSERPSRTHGSTPSCASRSTA